MSDAYNYKIYPGPWIAIRVRTRYGRAAIRVCCFGALTVYRSRNGGTPWKKLTKGLPQKKCFVQVLRQAGCADSCEDAGIYIGTNAGHIYYSRNSRDTWQLLAEHLPPILSLEAAVV